MNRKKMTLPVFMSALLAGVLTSSYVHAESEHQHGPDAEHGHPPSPENAAIQARLGDTGTLMGTIAIPESVETCGDQPGVTRLLCLIDLLKSSVSDDALALMQLDYSVAEAKKWSNLPAGAFPSRPGIFLGELKVEQRGVVKAILMEATGIEENEGFDELLQTLNADDYIGTVSDDYKAGYSSFNSKLAFLGTPSKTGLWELYYGGHHLALSNTYKDGELIGATPSFRGIEPFHAFEMNGRTNIPMLQERDTFAALLNSLTPEQLKEAELEGTYRDILAGPQADDAIPDQQEGMSVKKLSDTQKVLLLKAIATYVDDINAIDAKKYMDKYRSEMDGTVIGYSGTTDLNSEDDYVRVDGPSLWIEFSLQSNKSTNEKGNHPHSVWRDKTDDYGGQTE
ncbi:DUF3500 domain-containing protein [Psychromonas sp. 14N.309.X.WAT.B.A12]|uniref:DUF3500 domain-containing protein n=1 Tax=Psychromonas sp. 14N.309.X.WAT.B.A12 TaxID=2998322 RepID=UPI0025AF2E0F|nr:DUF3500 domain-containing protein [Psychromonas sp. 14N.309.X.WAT.B.A12]MDN2663878.1 DUF3500 domain-containing protein [Psychromonas sp. 14N.309.X.WAT.B.A12]